LVAVEGLTCVFTARGLRVTAVHDVSFTLARGETVGLVGESGSGKTTIGRALLRLIEPTGGRVTFDGLPVLAQRPAVLRRLRARMQYVFQDPFASLSPRMTVREILREGLDIQGELTVSVRNKRVAAALAAVELPDDALDRYPHEFSGGQRQRICIARALAMQPDLIVADEPVSALDVSIQAQILNLLRDLRSRMGLTMLFISHDLAVVERLCDRVIVLYLGRIMEIAPAARLYRDPRHPYTQALLSAVPDPDRFGRRERPALVGEIPSPANPPSGCVFRTRCPYALPRCAEAAPPLTQLDGGQAKACWRDDVPAFRP
jgi:peptide/nickel transport system ATP-binding protein